MNDGNGRNDGYSYKKEGLGDEAAHAAAHISADQMQHYAGGALAGLEEERVELHLTECDACLQLFMAAIEAGETIEQQNQLPDMRQLEEQVIAQLISEIQHVQSPAPLVHRSIRRRRTWLQHPVTHYVIAASITIMLFGSGSFASFSEKLQQYDQSSYAAAPELRDTTIESWSEKMINRTGSWLDGLQAARFK